MVEHPPCKRKVVGSNPIKGSILKLYLKGDFIMNDFNYDSISYDEYDPHELYDNAEYIDYNHLTLLFIDK